MTTVDLERIRHSEIFKTQIRQDWVMVVFVTMGGEREGGVRNSSGF